MASDLEVLECGSGLYTKNTGSDQSITGRLQYNPQVVRGDRIPTGSLRRLKGDDQACSLPCVTVGFMCFWGFFGGGRGQHRVDLVRFCGRNKHVVNINISIDNEYESNGSGWDA